MTSEDLQTKKNAAERAISSRSFSLAEKLYQEITLEDPNDWESPFMIAYCKAKGCIIAQIGTMALLMQGATTQAIKDIAASELPDLDKQSALQRVVDHSTELAFQLGSAAWNHFSNIGASIQANYNQEVISRVHTCLLICLECGSMIVRLFAGNEEAYKLAKHAFTSAYAIAKTCSYAADRKPYAFFSFNATSVFSDYFNMFEKCDKNALLKLEATRVADEATLLGAQKEGRVKTPVVVITILEVFFLILGIWLISEGNASWSMNELVTFGNVMIWGCMPLTALMYIAPAKANKDIKQQADEIAANSYH